MKFITLLTVFVTSLSAFAAKHSPKPSKDYLTIGSVEVYDLSSDYKAESFMENGPGDGLMDALNKKINSAALNATPVGQALNQADLIVDKVINIGTKIWTVVEKGRPVANYTKVSANALPANALRWDQLQNWQAPVSKVVGVVYKNLFGMEVVRFTYRIVLLYGGDVKGTGKYIGYAAVEPLEMTTAYMYTFNAKAEVQSVYNMGTSKDPLAGMVLNINWTIETVLKKSTVTHTYNLDGRGNIRVPSEREMLTRLK